MKSIGSFLALLMCSGMVFGSTPQDHQAQLNNEFAHCRTVVQTLTNDNASVLNQYDVFVETLQTAYNNGEGIIDTDVSLIIKAIGFSAEKHRLQTRKGPDSLPYIIHPIGVANNLMAIGNVRDPDIIIAALLHDTVEDTDTTFEEINAQFGLRVESFVRELTDNKSLPKAERKRLQLVNAPHKSAGAAQVKLSDKLYNLTDLLEAPPADWEKERIDEYFQWAKSVVDALPWVNAPLKAAVDQKVEAYKGR